MAFVKFAAFDGFSLTSKMIKFWTRSEYSHIAYVKDDGSLIECWGDRSPLGIFKVRWKHVHNPYPYINHSPGTPVEIWQLEVNDQEKTYIDQFMQKLADNHTKYDYWGVVAFVLKFVRDKKTKYFCSEGCITPVVQIKQWTKIKPYTVSPYDFVKIIQAAGGVMIDKFTLAPINK